SGTPWCGPVSGEVDRHHGASRSGERPRLGGPELVVAPGAVHEEDGGVARRAPEPMNSHRAGGETSSRAGVHPARLPPAEDPRTLGGNPGYVPRVAQDPRTANLGLLSTAAVLRATQFVSLRDEARPTPSRRSLHDLI